MAFHSAYDVDVPLADLAAAAEDALLATGLRHLPCECDADTAEAADPSFGRLFWNDVGAANRAAAAALPPLPDRLPGGVYHAVD